MSKKLLLISLPEELDLSSDKGEKQLATLGYYMKRHEITFDFALIANSEKAKDALDTINNQLGLPDDPEKVKDLSSSFSDVAPNLGSKVISHTDMGVLMGKIRAYGDIHDVDTMLVAGPRDAMFQIAKEMTPETLYKPYQMGHSDAGLSIISCPIDSFRELEYAENQCTHIMNANEAIHLGYSFGYEPKKPSDHGCD